MFPNSVSSTAAKLSRKTTNSAFTLPWMDKLSLESESLNNEHHAVLQKLNGLLIAISSGDGTRIVMACDILTAEARRHFASEEAQMREVGYPDFESHRDQHEELRRGLARLRYSVSAGSGFPSAASPLSYLEQWFVPHLSYADKRLADFLVARTAPSHTPASGANPQAAEVEAGSAELIAADSLAA